MRKSAGLIFVTGLVLVLSPVLRAQPNFVRSHALSYADTPRLAPGFAHFRNANPEAPKGGTLRIGWTGSFESLNPFYPVGRAPYELRTLFFQHLSVSPSDEWQAGYGLIARDFDVADDKRSMAVNLRPEARWHDGSPITAEDVEFTFHALVRHGWPGYRSGYRDVESVVVESPHRILFRFRTSTNRELPRVISGMPVLSKNYYRTHRFDQTSLQIPMASGPYRIASANSSGGRIEFERVPDYWAKDLPVQKGLFNFDRIILEYTRDYAIMFEVFKAGLMDFFWEWDAARWATGYGFRAVREGRVQRTALVRDEANGAPALIFNMRRAPFNDTKVRAALAELLNFEWINESYLWSSSERVTSFFHRSADLSAARGLPDADELSLLEPLRDQIPPEVFTTVYRPPNHSDGERIHLNRAFTLLQSAGFQVAPIRAGGLFAGKLIDPRTRRPFRIKFVYTDPATERFLLFYSRSLARLGIEAELTRIDSSALQATLRSFDFDAVFNYMNGYESPGNELRSSVASASAAEPGSENLPGITDPAVDRLVEAVIRAPTYRELSAAARALDRVLMWNHYFLPTWTAKESRLAFWDKFGRAETAHPSKFDPMSEWWMRDVRSAP